MAPHSQSKPSASKQHAPPVKEENINLDNVSEGSEDEDNSPPAPKARATGAGGANPPSDETAHVAPIIQTVVKSNRALDINLLFDCGKGRQSVCKYCK